VTVDFHPAAEQEFLEATTYYDEQETGLGLDFASEVVATVDRITAYPNAWPLVDEGVRRALLRTYPYGLIYAVDSDQVFILAVMHLHRSPGYWSARHDQRP
jgi:plasmid stabilization system protein ParE